MAAVRHPVAVDGNEARVQLASVEKGRHACLDDILQRLDALQAHDPATMPSPTLTGALQLMARV